VREMQEPSSTTALWIGDPRFSCLLERKHAIGIKHGNECPIEE